MRTGNARLQSGAVFSGALPNLKGDMVDLRWECSLPLIGFPCPAAGPRETIK